MLMLKTVVPDVEMSPIHDDVARTGNLCAALMSVDVAHAGVLSFIIVPNLLLKPYPQSSCPYFWESLF
jgi:hypothetical protein